MRVQVIVLAVSVAVLLCSCSGHYPGAGHIMGNSAPHIRPRLQVFIAPKDRVPIPIEKAILCRLDSPYHDKAQGIGIERIIKGTLLQTGIFSTLVDFRETDEYQQYVEAGVYEYAMDHGLGYCVEIRVEKILTPAGDSPGFCALSMKIKRVKDRVSIYYAYGEADLLPERARDYIFFTTPHKEAPTVLQGIVSIVRAMAHEFSKSGMGMPPSP